MCLEYVSFCRITFVNSLEASLRKQQDLFLSRITAPDSRTSYPRAKWATITSSNLNFLHFSSKPLRVKQLNNTQSQLSFPVQVYGSHFLWVILWGCWGGIPPHNPYDPLVPAPPRLQYPLIPRGAPDLRHMHRAPIHRVIAHTELPCDTAQPSSVFAFGKHHAAQLNRTAGGQSVQEGPLVVSCHLKRKKQIILFSYRNTCTEKWLPRKHDLLQLSGENRKAV